jgi:hypothetical protein
MKKFIDALGRYWVVDINVATIKRVKALTEINLLTVVEGELVERLSSDPILLCDVLYGVCKPQADREGISDEDFGAGLAGDAIADATTCLIEALVEFFPEPRRRLLQRAAAKFQQLQIKAFQMIETKLENSTIETNLLRQLENELQQAIPNNLSFASPES